MFPQWTQVPPGRLKFGCGHRPGGAAVDGCTAHLPRTPTCRSPFPSCTLVLPRPSSHAPRCSPAPLLPAGHPRHRGASGSYTRGPRPSYLGESERSRQRGAGEAKGKGSGGSAGNGRIKTGPRESRAPRQSVVHDPIQPGSKAQAGGTMIRGKRNKKTGGGYTAGRAIAAARRHGRWGRQKLGGRVSQRARQASAHAQRWGKAAKSIRGGHRATAGRRGVWAGVHTVRAARRTGAAPPIRGARQQYAGVPGGLS